MLATKADPGGGSMQFRAVLLAASLALAPVGTQGADLLVWWDEGYYAQEAEAATEVVAAFEQTTGKEVELTFHSSQAELPEKIVAALEASPDISQEVGASGR
jgi:ABC-type glycerol-3-phosphate transport system substrate-binding protein